MRERGDVFYTHFFFVLVCQVEEREKRGTIDWKVLLSVTRLLVRVSVSMWVHFISCL